MTADLLPLLWMAPALLLLVLVFLWPWAHYFWLSFHASSLLTGLAAIPNGGANWQRLLQDSRFWKDDAEARP